MNQDEYIAILFNDCGFTGEQRRAWLQAEYGYRHSDELKPWEKSKVIDRLKVIKEGQKEIRNGGSIRYDDQAP